MLKQFLIIISLFFVSLASAQDDDSYVYGDSGASTTTGSTTTSSKGFDWSRTTFGGGVNFLFGSNTVVLLSPTMGYYLTDNLIAGVGLNYLYENNKTYSVPFSATTYGGSVYTQYLLPDLPILLHTEVETAHVVVSFNNSAYENIVLDMVNLYVGGGIKQKMGNNSYVYFLMLYNLNETKESNFVQRNPIIRAGFAIGF